MNVHCVSGQVVQVALPVLESPLKLNELIVVAEPAVPANIPVPAKTLQPLEKLTVVGDVTDES